MTGQRLGNYELVKLLATGGMGEVFLARPLTPIPGRETVVIKKILRHLASDQNFVDMFVNEARLSSLLKHHNIVEIFELKQDDGDWYIVMEHVAGRSLQASIEQVEKKHTNTDPRIAAYVCARALDGLQYAHQLTDSHGKPLGILHRDVTPDNVLISTQGEVKLLDFGIAKATNSSAPSSTLLGTVKGKVSYMAPEQFVIGGPVDVRVDVYAMGVTLHELMFTLRPSCVPQSPEEAEQPRLGFTRRRDLPAMMNDILERALYPDVAYRFSSAKEMAQALDTFVETTGRPITEKDVAEWQAALFDSEVSREFETAASSALLSHGTDVLASPFVVSSGISIDDLASQSPTIVGPRPFEFPELKTQMASAGGPGRRRAVMALTVLIFMTAAGLGFWQYSSLSVPTAPVAVAPFEKPPPLEKALPPDSTAKVNLNPDTDAPDIDDDSEPAPVKKAIRRRTAPRPGRVIIKVTPWAEVIYQGRSYGVTPVSPISVPAGTAKFTLKNKQLGITRQVTIKVPPGGNVVLKADLNKAKRGSD